MKLYIYLVVFFAALLMGCNKEHPSLDLTITPSSFDVDSGEEIDFEITGDAEFLVFYSGLEGQLFEDYPNAITSSIDMLATKPKFTYVYKYHGTVNAVFIATSYGNWGADSKEEKYEFTFNVTDNNTDVGNVILKNGLFGSTYQGLINTETKTVVVTLPEGEPVSNINVNLVSSSPLATIYHEGEVYSNNSKLNFTSTGKQSFTIKSIGGDEATWDVIVEFE